VALVLIEGQQDGEGRKKADQEGKDKGQITQGKLFCNLCSALS
jgi:hypothetical protein